MLPTITNMLAWWQWALVGAVPLAIIALYFLKLKRQPLEVPSTYLWHKSIEDLHVNSIWQRLRQSLLLLLQLLLVTLAILALLRPTSKGQRTISARSIFIIDNSASMSATDVTPGQKTARLDEAKRQVLELIDQMESDHVAMVISVSNRPTVEHPFTDDRRALRRAVERIKPTQKTTDLHEALRVASGIANPNRTETDPSLGPTAAPLPADMYLFTDGKFQHPNFALGNLNPKYIKIGSEQPKNVAIVAFNAERVEDKPGELRVFARLENYGPEDVEVAVDLFLDDNDQNEDLRIAVPKMDYEKGAAGYNGVSFKLQNVESGVLKLHIDANDDLEIDDTAWFAVNAPRRAKVLVVTSGNEYLIFGLQTGRADKLASLTIKEPSYLATDEYRAVAAGGAYDLVVYDRCLPAGNPDNEKTPTPMPECNTWFIGVAPKLPLWGWEPGKAWPPKEVFDPKILDVARAHPLMQLAELGDIRKILSGIPLRTPPGGTTLIDTLGDRAIGEKGQDAPGKGEAPQGEKEQPKEAPKYESVQAAILAIGPREGHEDLILGTPLVGDFEGKRVAYTDWIAQRSFPVFLLNVLTYLGGGHAMSDTRLLRPGETAELKMETSAEKLLVNSPDGSQGEIARGRQNLFRFSNTDALGAYELRTAGATGESLGRFAVNLFDAQESDLRPAPHIDFQWEKVNAEANFQPERREYWKWLILLALLVLLFEWYIYNRRVYL
jgi:hypothetical protein